MTNSRINMAQIPRIMIAGTHSGVGKTTIATGLMGALAQKGLRVQPFKVGPDFIDPTYHTIATGQKGRNLDTWMLGEDAVQRLFNRAAGQADIAVIEGVMGLFDGSSGSAETGSSAQIAKLLKCPVILVVDVKSMARSAAALVQGFVNFDPEVLVAGVILNRIGSDRHLSLVREAIEQNCGLPVVGFLRKNAGLELPSRHLGLIPAGEKDHLRPAVDRLAEIVAGSLDLERVLEIARPDERASVKEPASSDEHRSVAASAQKVRIGLALDEAFSFYYQDALEVLEEKGAELVPFSPLHDSGLPPDLSGLYIGGGFPEIFLPELADNRSILRDIFERGRLGMPILAECGGYMYLAGQIKDFEGRIYKMVGLVPAACSMQKGLAGMGYVQGAALSDNNLARKGTVVKGHEFHYSRMEPENPSAFQYAYRLERNRYRETVLDGFANGRILASYVHHHFAADPGLAERFVSTCKAYQHQLGE